ncbi:MAG: hypothetical protein Q8P41_08110 [Pseudomonadota bacterium]|nr:hypothetical protein [Pseudomonadota bacterium]
MAVRKANSISINGRRLEEVGVRGVARWATNTTTTTSYPVHQHSCVAIEGGLEIRTQPITVAQLFVEGILTADRQRAVVIKVGAAKEAPYTMDAMLREEDPYLQAVAVLRFKAAH